mmetsp:Transcript_19426/g.29196  ORF Transcript_19426/g.29196 Transcript_19426/m.29196 type:complete len:146 (+) Transcript_19426:63-500(+)|eukprot:CAMPEP_0178905722 /NCGR_PEP_ID=MMETSP0786-20121207/6433_1 /TAXON_ID=186022 /ORGANISM="Thalassionema frauenfeldii, Strain CCMP 1798" /LENGTH=145 /DNA_ID=CAMNT_0020577361 /DNA_START=31 /DNA_END=468 /DNA_ORIENTATION=+
MASAEVQTPVSALPESSETIGAQSYPKDDDDRSTRSDESVAFQGKSDCGFTDTIHDTLMAAGAAVHSLIGEPPSVVQGAMKETGDFVKDTAVALNDLKNADRSIIEEETHELLKMMTDGGEEDDSPDPTDPPKETPAEPKPESSA